MKTPCKAFTTEKNAIKPSIAVLLLIKDSGNPIQEMPKRKEKIIFFTLSNISAKKILPEKSVQLKMVIKSLNVVLIRLFE